ncbi:hypothetical protein B0J13DRAFT_534387 [Dactylonectria estremocensis]|uniref:Uncharacterized protein n=1 Tax=Dactylonectria estremocensis TaxID=1079267 RepID=A0A9P9I983_9HYPO|nr:hypothetical protein B0J13DRAFT_534387 [Dactylonectria estremocensis]
MAKQITCRGQTWSVELGMNESAEYCANGEDSPAIEHLDPSQRFKGPELFGLALGDRVDILARSPGLVFVILIWTLFDVALTFCMLPRLAAREGLLGIHRRVHNDNGEGEECESGHRELIVCLVALTICDPPSSTGRLANGLLSYPEAGAGRLSLVQQCNMEACCVNCACDKGSEEIIQEPGWSRVGHG